MTLSQIPAQPSAEAPPSVVLDVRVVTGTGGGPDKTILNSPRFLAPQGYHNLCAYMHPPGDPGFDELRKKAAAWGAPLISVPDRGPCDWRVVRQLGSLCRQERVAIWHGHDYKSNVLGILLRRYWPMRLVTTVHGWVKFTRRTPLYYAMDRLCLRHYEKVICVSQDLVERSLAAGVPADRCLLVENGVDTVVFARRQSLEAAKRNLGFRADRLLIGAVGRLSEEKGFEPLVRAVAQIIAEGADVELVVIGEGDRRAALEHLIAELRLGDRIRLLGYRQDLRELYEAMDLFVLSSVREGLPNVVLEAMAMETPVVATAVAGVPRLLRHDQNGIMIPDNAVENLVGGLRRMVADPELRRRLAAAGRRTIEANYSFRTRMEKIRALYDEILDRPARRQDRAAAGAALTSRT